jgi:hypothetical protein
MADLAQVVKGHGPRLPEFLADERGAEQMEYLILLAGLVLPLLLAARLMWAVLLYYFRLEAFVVDLPFL